jgi:hypothetical protein
MTVKSPLLERMAAIGVVWVFSMMTFCLVLPYCASYLGIAISEADRALVNNIVSAVNNAFVWVLGFLYGQSVGTRQKDAALATSVNTNANLQAALTPSAQASPDPAGDKNAGPVDSTTP